MTKTPINLDVAAAVTLCGGKQSLLAERMGCAQQTVSKLLTGEIKIDANWAVRISKATGGLLKAPDMCPDLAEVIEASQ